MFFFGTFEHTIDGRGRLAIPARYRHAFVDGSDATGELVRGVVRIGPEGCVELYTQESFNEEVERRLGSANGNRTPTARRIRRSFLSEAYPVEIDRQNRFVIPTQLREEADLSTEHEDGDAPKVLIIGCGDYLELWHPSRWAEEQARLEALEALEDGDEDERA